MCYSQWLQRVGCSSGADGKDGKDGKAGLPGKDGALPNECKPLTPASTALTRVPRVQLQWNVAGYRAEDSAPM